VRWFAATGLRAKAAGGDAQHDATHEQSTIAPCFATHAQASLGRSYHFLRIK
jgi:hypothetical protein